MHGGNPCVRVMCIPGGPFSNLLILWLLDRLMFIGLSSRHCQEIDCMKDSDMPMRKGLFK